MIQKGLLFALIICSTLASKAQNTLTLTVKNLSDASKVTLTSGTTVIQSGDSIPFIDSNFVITIKPNGLKFILSLQAASGGSLMPKLFHITANTTLTIKDAKLVSDPNFMVGSVMTFKVEQEDANATLVKSYLNLKFKVPVKIDSGQQAEVKPGQDIPLPPPPASYHAGSAYFDALYLENTHSRDTIYEILQYYVGPNSHLSKPDLKDYYKANPFLHALIDSIFALDLAENKIRAENNPISFSSLSSSIGGLDVTTIANGIADLMIDRAKQELTVAFFNHFKTFAEKNPEFGILFPKTTSNLENLLTYSYPQMLPALRAGFLQDIQQIPSHLDDVLALPRYVTLLKNYPEVRMAIRSLRLVQELETGASNAANVFSEFAGFPEWTDPAASRDLKNIGFCVKAANLLSQSILNDSTRSNTNTVWVPGKDLKNLFYDPRLFNLYEGLLYEQGKTILYTNADGSTTSFADLLKNQQNNLFVFQNKLKEFFDLADKVDATLTSIKEKKKTNTSPTNDDYYNYVNTAIDVINYGFEVAQIFDKVIVADDYIALARKSNDLYKDIYTKEYTQAIEDGLGIFTTLDSILIKKINIKTVTKSTAVKSSTDASVKSLRKGNSAFDNIQHVVDATVGDTTAASDQNIKQLGQYRTLQNLLAFIEKLKPYALFMANIVQAKDENAVKAALNNVILPVGSSSIKKNTRCNISVQSYLGAFWAYNNIPLSTIGTFSDKFGVIAPIGISWTPNWLSYGKGGSFSIFASLFDLGAIVDYKLQQDSTYNTAGSSTVVTKSYSVKLGQLFAPGGYIVYGLAWNTPISIGWGGEYGPGLSKINPTTNKTTVSNPFWRWNFFIAVDLPFFNLVNKSKTINK